MPSRPPKNPRAVGPNSGKPPPARNELKPPRGARHRGDAGNQSNRILGHVAATGRRMQAKRDAKPRP